jgi:zinc protease
MISRRRTLLLAAAFLALGAAGAPAAESAEGLPHLAFEMFRLPNGLTVIVHQDRTTPLVGVHVEYDVGSKDERPGRTGFAHLFEHLMFQGTAHLPKGEAFRLVEAAGGEGNGSTAPDQTVYWEQAPSNALEQLMYIESDRMGWLLPTLTQDKLDNQREVVLNERRQSYEMRPYGLVFDKLQAALWDPEFPYHWLTIGVPADIEAANLEDVRAFFARWYGPENAVLAVAGDVDVAEVHRLAEKYFGPIAGKPRPVRSYPAPHPLTEEKRLVLEDRVQLPRLYLAWQTPKVFAAGDAALDLVAAILGDGKSARLVNRLQMSERIVQSVSASQMSQTLASTFVVVATPKPGVGLDRLKREIDEELARLAAEPPTAAELERAKNKFEAGAVFGLEPVGGFGGRAASLAGYYVRTGDPGYLQEDLARYRAVTPADVSSAARIWLGKDARVAVEVHPSADGGGGPTASDGGAP